MWGSDLAPRGDVRKGTAGAGSSCRVEQEKGNDHQAEARRDQVRALHLAVGDVEPRLEVSSPEDVKEVDGQSQGEEESHDGVRMAAIPFLAMVGRIAPNRQNPAT
jgi:hypothetical protein